MITFIQYVSLIGMSISFILFGCAFLVTGHIRLSYNLAALAIALACVFLPIGLIAAQF